MTKKEETKVMPLCIGPRNAEAMIGHTWRWLRDHAAELGVDFITIDRKRVILAAPLLAALERRARPSETLSDGDDELAAMRERIRRAG